MQIDRLGERGARTVKLDAICNLLFADLVEAREKRARPFGR